MIQEVPSLGRVRSQVPGCTVAGSCRPSGGCSHAHTSAASSRVLPSHSPGVSLAYYRARRGFVIPNLLFYRVWVVFSVLLFPSCHFWWPSLKARCPVILAGIRQNHSAAEEGGKNIKVKALTTSPESPIVPNLALQIEGGDRNPISLSRGC